MPKNKEQTGKDERGTNEKEESSNRQPQAELPSTDPPFAMDALFESPDKSDVPLVSLDQHAGTGQQTEAVRKTDSSEGSYFATMIGTFDAVKSLEAVPGMEMSPEVVLNLPISPGGNQQADPSSNVTQELFKRPTNAIVNQEGSSGLLDSLNSNTSTSQLSDSKTESHSSAVQSQPTDPSKGQVIELKPPAPPIKQDGEQQKTEKEVTQKARKKSKRKSRSKRKTTTGEPKVKRPASAENTKQDRTSPLSATTSPVSKPKGQAKVEERVPINHEAKTSGGSARTEVKADAAEKPVMPTEATKCTQPAERKKAQLTRANTVTVRKEPKTVGQVTTAASSVKVQKRKAPKNQ